MPGRKRKASQAIPISKLVTEEATENIMSSECILGFEFIARNCYSKALLNMPSFEGTSVSNLNFEFAGNLLAFPSIELFKMAEKLVEVREIRGRGAQRKSAVGMTNFSYMKLGVFTSVDISPGVFIIEYLGHVQVPQLLQKKPGAPERVQQSLVLFIPNIKPSICIDARSIGNVSRHIRRSCRPNCEVKIVITGGTSGEDVHVGIFARNSILENEELFLPIDFEHGNEYFRYECACGNSELCLGPEGSIPVPKQRTSTYEMVDSSKPFQRAKTPQQPSGQQSTFLATAAAGQKLSREERKLLQYIEQIEKMDSAEHKKASRKSSNLASSSAPNLTESHSPSGKSSPKRSPRPSLESPRKSLSTPNVPFKEEVEAGYFASDSESKAVIKKTKSGPGRPPKSPSEKRTLKEQVKVKPKKRPKIIPEDDQSAGEDETAYVDIGKPDVYKNNKDAPEEDPFTVHIGTESPVSGPIERASTSSPYSTHTPPSSTPIEESTSQMETPSKKRVSLSDYMKKRRATGDQTREEGEIMSPTVTSYPSTYSKEPSFSRPEPIHEHFERHVSDTRHYEMPPHLTPPPPLATSNSLTMEIEYPARSESASTGYYGPSRFDRKQSSSGRYYDNPEPNVGASRYGYQSSSRSAYPPSEPSRPQSYYDSAPQQPLYKPRPSLLKAAQDLPTRWEEASRSDRDHRPDYYSSSRPSMPPSKYSEGYGRYEDPYGGPRRSYSSSNFNDEPPSSRPYYDEYSKPSESKYGNYQQYPPSLSNPEYHPGWRRPSSTHQHPQQPPPTQPSPPPPQRPSGTSDPRQHQGQQGYNSRR